MKKIKKYFKEKLDEAEQEFTNQDVKKIMSGKKPYWAKSVSEVPPRKKSIAGSNDATERAMRSVTNTNKFADPYRESDLKRDRVANIKMNQDILDKVNAKIGSDNCYANQNFVCLIVGEYEYRIFHKGLAYSVHRLNTEHLFDREYENFKTISDVVNYIQKDMNESTRILENNGYKFDGPEKWRGIYDVMKSLRIKFDSDFGSKRTLKGYYTKDGVVDNMRRFGHIEIYKDDTLFDVTVKYLGRKGFLATVICDDDNTEDSWIVKTPEEAIEKIENFILQF